MKILLRIAAILIGLILVLWICFELFAAPFVKSTIEEKLTYYRADSVRIGSVNIKLFPIGLEVNDAWFNLYLPADTLLVQWRGNLSHLEVGGIDWYKAWKEEVWDVGEIEIGEGEVNWRVTHGEFTDTSRFKTTSDKVKPDILLRDLTVDELNLNLERDSFTVSLQTSINLDSLSVKRKDSVQWKLSRVVLHSRNADFKNVVNDYNLRYRELRFDSRDSLLQISGFRMDPRISRADFARKYPFRKVQPKLKVAEISMSGVDVSGLNRGVYARKLLIDSADIQIYQDIRKERPEVRKPLPSELIAKIPIKIDVDSIQLINGYLKYQHQSDQEDVGLATLLGDRLELNVYPISNIGHSNSADVNIDGSVRLMGKADVSLKSHCFADKPLHDFKVDLSMGQTPISVFNDILYPTIGIKVKKGVCDGARVRMRGNDNYCEGDLDIAYNDLKIALPPDQKSDLNILGKAGEMLGNFALVNGNNSMDANNGQIYYKRPEKEPFVNFWWKGVQRGLLDAILRFYQNPDKN